MASSTKQKKHNTDLIKIIFLRPDFDSRQRQAYYLLSTASRLSLRTPQPPILWVPRALPRVNNAWNYASTSYVFTAWLLVKRRMSS
jgi:hypothetical protein